MSPRGVLLPAALAVVWGVAAVHLAREAHAERSVDARTARGLPPLGIAGVLAVDLLWLRADGLYAAHRWPEMTAAYELAGRIEPRLAAAFEFRGFHLAYNLAGNAASDEDRDRWVMEGIEVLRQGQAQNQGSVDLRGWLGQALFERTKRWPSLVPKLKARSGRDPWDEAAEILRAAVRIDPGHGLNVLRLTDVLDARGKRHLEAGRRGAAADDFRRGAEVLRALAPSVPADARPALDALLQSFEEQARAAGK